MSSIDEYIRKSRKNKTSSKHRSYAFTLNNYTVEEMCDIIATVPTKYIIIGFEEGENETPHIQGYVQFHNSTAWSTIKRMIPRAHIEPAKGTPAQNIKYCSKDGEFYEFGDRPTNGAEHGHKSKELTEKIVAALEDPLNNVQIVRQYGNAYQHAKQLALKQKKVETKFYSFHPISDPIAELYEYFDNDELDLTIIYELNELSFYDDPQNVYYIPDNDPQHIPLEKMNMWSRGMPIIYKHGYEMRCIKPERFIIKTSNRKLFPLYRNI